MQSLTCILWISLAHPPQRKCKQAIRDAKKYFDTSKHIKTDSNEVYKYFSSKKLAKVGPLDDNGIKGVLKDSKRIAEKLNEFF